MLNSATASTTPSAVSSPADIQSQFSSAVTDEEDNSDLPPAKEVRLVKYARVKLYLQ